MFSGIIKEIGKIVSLELSGEDAVLGVCAPMFSSAPPEQPVAGDSVAICGVCLTVTRIQDGAAYFDLASETRRCTTLGRLAIDSQVNLERSLRFGERLDGHLVQGHVDAVAELLRVSQEENTYRFEFSLPSNVSEYAVPKGSIAIDGVSLTVGEVSGESFSVYIIPFTISETIFSEYAPGSKVNIESDCVARYLKKLALPYSAASAAALSETEEQGV